jgi:outer membrane immunogenic protein
LIGVAGARDLPGAEPVYRTYVNTPVPAYNWSGFYIGAHAGYGWQFLDVKTFDSTGVVANTINPDQRGWLGGGQVGYNWMVFDKMLVGIEADFAGAEISGTSANCASQVCALSNSNFNPVATVRGRLGYAWNTVLFYGTAGWAWSRSETTRTITCVVDGGGTCPGGPSPSALTGQTLTVSGTQSGWAAGAGIEWGFHPSWSARAEFLHLEFDDVPRDFTYPGFPAASRHIVSSYSTNLIRFGVNYLFMFR